MGQISPARKVAFDILLKLERGNAHSDDLLRGKAVTALALQDRNLATTLALGVLRWQLSLDAIVRPLLKRPDAKLDAEVLIALRLGAFQLLHLDRIPARAAIDESVELAKQAGHRFASGMVNAVLRKLVAQPKHAARDLSAHPAWMVERWKNFFGEETTCAICRHGQSQPSLTLRLVDATAEADLMHAGIQLDAGELLAAARVVLAGDVTAMDAFRDGRVRVQDEGSQLIAEIAGKGSAILDCCAAPGGKTLILAERNPQARVVACEASAPRYEALKKRLAPLGDRVECRLADVTTLCDEAVYDVVLADVPCSGTGTLARNPEIRHRLKPEDIARQVERQFAIFDRAIRAVRSGGRIVYSTCSLEPEEDEQVIAAALRENANVRVGLLAARLEAMGADGVLTPQATDKLKACLTPEGFLRLIPGAFGTDGFFVALLEKL